MATSPTINESVRISQSLNPPGPLINETTRIKVSSTLDKSVGKKNLTDGSAETCWTSTPILPQSIQLTFASPVIPSTVSLTFQGGFTGTRCSVYAQGDSKTAAAGWKILTTIYPEDVNRRQTFSLAPSTSSDASITQLKFVFEESSDFFGRITLYDLSVEGLHMPISDGRQ